MKTKTVTVGHSNANTRLRHERERLRIDVAWTEERYGLDVANDMVDRLLMRRRPSPGMVVTLPEPRQGKAR